MLYQLLRLPLVLLFLAFYRRIHFSQKKNFPRKGAVIVASNHSTACCEQILIATFQWRSVFFWARASVFPGGFWNWLFRQGHLIPIYRPQEGLKSMAKNKDTFSASEQLLLDGNVMYIAPEGNCVMEKRLREFKTGTARLALQTAAATGFTQPVYVLPTGVNYSHHTNYRSDVMISFGEPISVLKFKDLYIKSPSEATKQLNEEMLHAIRKEMVYIEQKEDEMLTEQLFTLFRNNNGAGDVFPAFTTDRSRLEMEQQVAETVNCMTAEDKQMLADACRKYFKSLNNNYLDDKAVSQQYSSSYLRASLLVAFFPLASLGYWGGWLPLNAARYLRRRWVHDMQFWAPVAIVASSLTWFVYGLLVLTAGAFLLGWWALLLLVGLVTGQFTATYHEEAWLLWKQNRFFGQWQNNNQATALELKKQRQTIVDTMLQHISRRANGFSMRA